jgi:hypothetical protein
MGTWRETRRRAERIHSNASTSAAVCFVAASLARPLALTMVVRGDNNEDRVDADRVGGDSSNNPAAHRWGPDSQGGETSAAEMLQSLQPVRDLAQNFDIDIAT